MDRVADILVVDDTVANLQLLSNLLKDEGYKIRPATSGKLALQAVQQVKPDLILLDIKMPEMDGYEVCRILKATPEHRDIPILFISALSDVDDKIKAFQSGGVDYIEKPFQVEEVKARVATHLQLKEYQDNLEEKVKQGLSEIQTLNQEMIATQSEVIFTMGEICETRSHETGMHVRRVSEYSYLLAKLGDVAEAEMIRQTAPMHDIGKVAIPDSILNKPGPLTDDEWVVMKTHSRLGYQMLDVSDRDMFKMAAIIALHHHEKWDGSGYPDGLQGEDIHIAGRIVAIADVFDALGNDRCYKKAWPLEQILELLKEGTGKAFDPHLIELFMANLDKFLEISIEYAEKV
ncbi:MAG: response regulator [Methylophaga sp.]|nr:response regulator [Methylophaga sp.]